MSDLLPKHGVYRKLLSFQDSQLVFDITVRFVKKYIPPKSRTCDQMERAARSGVQNIAEGSVASATSKKFELKLTQVARASLEELKLDYEDFIRQKNLSFWDKNNLYSQELVNQRFKTADEVSSWIEEVVQRDQLPKSLYPEFAANAAIVLIRVACSLLERQVTRLAEDFQQNGGFTEKLYNARKRR
ncbi:MAG: four helix bundle suffix domain-containing protein [Lentisphaeria bacterium]|nr:four helix bundle suffix domain-containing protein [Lentisphaeria bacterium]